MIVVDSSAVVAIFLQQPDAARHARCIADDDQPLMSAANVLETSIVLRTLKRISPDEADGWLDEFLAAAEITVEPVTVEQSRLARAAHARYGKGGGGPAQLNLGDCFAYAMAKAMDAPLLFKGDDFGHTDVGWALAGD